MTICLLAKFPSPKKGEFFVSAAADSEITAANVRILGVEGPKKLIRIKNAIIAVAGSGPTTEAVEDLVKAKSFLKGKTLSDKEDIRVLGEAIFTNLKGLIDRSPKDEDKDVLEGLSHLLIATPYNIWKVYTDLSTYSFEEFTASGAGEDVCTGAMEVSYQILKEKENVTHDDLDAAMLKAMQATTKYVLSCGDPVQILRAFKPRKIEKLEA